ncbi:MAG: ABC transporter ATP-binding protein [Kiritimatiellae bacterium]|nr:ABC transporter ATP-binding protein [Kiritimatiellia bacterium]
MDKSKLSTIVSFLFPYRRRFYGIVALTVVLSVVVMVPPLVMRSAIDRVIIPGDLSAFPLLAGLFLALPLIHALLQFVQETGVAVLGQRFVFDVRCALFRRLLSMSMRFYAENNAGMLANRLMGDTNVVHRMLTTETISVLTDIVSCTFAVIASFALNWRLGMLLFVIIPFFIVNYRLNIGKIRARNRDYWAAMDRVSAGIQDRLIGTVTVKTFGTEGREQSAFEAQSESSLKLSEDLQIASTRFSLNTYLVRSLGHAGIFFAGCALVLRGDISYGDVTAFTAYAMQLLLPAVRFSMIARRLQDVGVASERIAEIYLERREIREPASPVHLPAATGCVDFNRVHFAYEPGKPVLNGFDLHVAPGRTVALIGPTGCGKTTVCSLLLRFFDVTGGCVAVDGRDVRSVALASLRRQIGVVLQESQLFDMSIRDNIRYGRPQAGEAAVQAAARAVELHDFVSVLPDGYHTLIGTGALELSVGQKQRIAIARALVANPAILIMDEATSAMDSESESAVQRAMARVLKGRTCFIVAHRLSTIRNVDCIVLMSDGRIVEQGTHAELMAMRKGRYRALYLRHMSTGSLIREPEEDATP